MPFEDPLAANDRSSHEASFARFHFCNLAAQLLRARSDLGRHCFHEQSHQSRVVQLSYSTAVDVASVGATTRADRSELDVVIVGVGGWFAYALVDWVFISLSGSETLCS